MVSRSKQVLLVTSLFGLLAFTQIQVNAQTASSSDGVTDSPVQQEDEAARVQSFEEALDQDAEGYARLVGVSREVAKQRLRALNELRDTKIRIRQTFGSRFAGIAIDHTPQLQLTVLLTGGEAVPTESVSAGGLAVPIIYRTGARSTLQQLRDALKQHQAAIRRLIPATQGIGISTRTGELIVVVNAAGAAATAILTRDAELETLTGVPVRLEVVQGTDINMDVRGGSRVEGNNPTDGKRYRCTTGFAVKNQSGTTGVATAAHCEDRLTYYNPNGTQIPLTFLPETASGYGAQDVQVHTSTYVERPEFYVDTAKTQVRKPVGWYSLDHTYDGDPACHRGETTGASCSFVEWVYYAPPHEKCAGFCDSTYIAVRGPDCKSGDSGGPVYDLNVGRGLLKDGNYNLSTGVCNFYFYMPMDFLPEGWSLLLG